MSALTVPSDFAMYQMLRDFTTESRPGEYYRLGSQPDHFAQFERKLDSLGGPTGPWTSRGWDRPNTSAIEAAREAIVILREINLPPNGVTATAKGGVGIRFTSGRRYGSIEFLNSGDVVQLKMGAGVPNATPVEPSPAGTRQALVDLRLFLGT